MKKEISIARMLPVLFGFFVMGFCDVGGIVFACYKDFEGQESVEGMIMHLSEV